MKQAAWFKISQFGWILLVLLTACNYPTAGIPTDLPAEVVYTQAAETIVAQLTAVAGGGEAQPTEATVPGAASPTALSSATLTPTETMIPSETPTPTITPTPEPTATLTPASTDPRNLLGDPDWRDRFRNDNNWSPFEDDNVRFRIGEDELVMVALQDIGWDSWMISWPQPENFYLELTARSEGCSGLDRYGLILRTDAEEGYLFGLSCDGRYSFRMWNGEKFSALIDWTGSAAINAGPDQSNRLGVWAEGNRYKLYINGQPQVEIEDNRYDEGSFGVFIGSVNTEGYRVRASEIAYWELP